ncbi:MAG: PAS domain S-box protein [Deltaproteobacteria bacterium]|nr:PAS domain S-box protein [Deltaproteobacteria bacterium]
MFKHLRRFRSSPLFVVLVYAFFGYLWIKYSDLFLGSIVNDAAALTQLQTWKGWLFITITAILLYSLVIQHTREVLKRAGERRNLMVMTPLPLLVLKSDGVISLVNDAFSAQFGYVHDELPNAKAAAEKLFPNGQYRAQVLNQWQADMKAGELGTTSRRERTYELTDKAGAVHIVRFFAIQQANEYILMCQDITDELQLRQTLHQSEKMSAVGQMAGGIAHDFNNQLAIIAGALDLIKMTLSDSRDIESEIYAIDNAVQHASSLTGQLLLFSRREKLEMKKIDLNQLVDELVLMISKSLTKKIDINFQRMDGMLLCNGDPSRLSNCLLNLAINARDAMPKGGLLRFETTATATHAIVRCRDTGDGIPKDVLPHIFEPFFTTKAEGKGTGLGLSVVYGTIKSHKGQITVQSVIGEGTTFEISLPLLKTDHPN